MKLSVVLAVRNEEKNIRPCLESVLGIADEIVIVDEHSQDKTAEIAKNLGAKVYEHVHEDNFHINKQRALDYASGEWILQLDADEIISESLKEEIKKTVSQTNEELVARRKEVLFNNKLFLRHQNLIEKRDGKIGRTNGEIVAFFIPRRNIFLGKPLIYAGVYPDPAIRLVKKGKAHFPAKSVHEIMEIDGEVSWLENDMLHNDSPNLGRYFSRLNRYTDLKAKEILSDGTKKNWVGFLAYSFFYPLKIFFKLFIRHKGFLDGYRGFMWSLLSAMHYPISYYKFWVNTNE